MTSSESGRQEALWELPDPEILKARETAARMLGRRPLSVKGLGDKLQEKGFSQEVVSETLTWLTERGYLNDEEFARLVIRSYTGRGYGPMRLRQELYRRGVARELADTLVAQAPANEEQIDEYIKKKLRGRQPDRGTKKRVADGLLRRGFSYEEIRRGLDRWIPEETEETESWQNE